MQMTRIMWTKAYLFCIRYVVIIIRRGLVLRCKITDFHQSPSLCTDSTYGRILALIWKQRMKTKWEILLWPPNLQSRERVALPELCSCLVKVQERLYKQEKYGNKR